VCGGGQWGYGFEILQRGKRRGETTTCVGGGPDNGGYLKEMAQAW